MSSELAILGCGARTPVGLDRGSSAAAVRAGISAIAEHPFLLDRFGEPMLVTRDARLDPRLAGPERLAALAIPAARAALAPLEHGRRAVKLVLAVGLASGRPGQEDGAGAAVAGRLCDALSGAVTIEGVLPLPEGHAGGLLALAAARRMITEGSADVVLAGGVDSYLSQDTLEWLDDTEQLHSAGNIYGFCPGEGAGFVLVARLETARRLGCAPLIELVAVGTGTESNRIRTEDICLGAGLSAAFREATRSLDAGEQIERIVCDMNGERYRGNEYGFAILKHPGPFRDAAAFEAPADCWGDVGAASGPLYISLVVEAEARGYSRGPLSLVWASSVAGQRAAATLRRSGAR